MVASERRRPTVQPHARAVTAERVQAPEHAPLPSALTPVRSEPRSQSGLSEPGGGPETRAPIGPASVASSPAAPRPSGAESVLVLPGDSRRAQAFTDPRATESSGPRGRRSVAMGAAVSNSADVQAEFDSSPSGVKRSDPSVTPARPVAHPLSRVSASAAMEEERSARTVGVPSPRDAGSLERAPATPVIPDARSSSASSRPGVQVSEPAHLETMVRARPATSSLLIPPGAARRRREAADPDPTVQVRIGRVEVRSAALPEPPPAPARRTTYGFDEYLSLRSYSKGS
jgi:hypothetical protein